MDDPTYALDPAAAVLLTQILVGLVTLWIIAAGVFVVICIFEWLKGKTKIK